MTVILLYILYLIRGVIPSIIYGAIIAYILLPVTNFFSRKMPRGLASFVSLLIFFVIIVLIAYFVFPIIFHEITQLVTKIPDIYRNISTLLSKIRHLLVPSGTEVLENMLQNFFDNLQNYLYSFVQSVFTKTISKVTIFPLMIFSFLLAFFFMKDSRAVYRITLRRINPPVRKKWRFFLDKTNGDLRAYFSTLVLIAFFTGITMGLISSIIGVKYAVLIGVIDVFLEMLPYVGPTIVFIVGVLLSLITSFKTFILFAIVFSIIEFIQNSLVTPHFVGERLKITPVIIIVMIAIGGAIFGALGVIIATPTFLILRNLFQVNKSQPEETGI